MLVHQSLSLNLFSYDTLDMAVQDLNGNNIYDKLGDKILVGRTQIVTTDTGEDSIEWVHTNFSILFWDDPSDNFENYPWKIRQIVIFLAYLRVIPSL